MAKKKETSPPLCEDCKKELSPQRAEDWVVCLDCFEKRLDRWLHKPTA